MVTKYSPPPRVWPVLTRIPDEAEREREVERLARLRAEQELAAIAVELARPRAAPGSPPAPSL